LCDVSSQIFEMIDLRQLAALAQRLRIWVRRAGACALLCCLFSALARAEEESDKIEPGGDGLLCIGGSIFPCWAEDEWRLWKRDSCQRPRTLLAWAGTERRLVDGSEVEPLASDRPDFTEASSTVGYRRLQLEMGYTYIRDSSQSTLRSAHSFPETLLRIGMLAEWFEARIAWNYGISLNRENVVSNIFDGGEDLYLGAKIMLTEQDGWRPEMSILPQMNLPTGGPESTDHQVTPGVNWLYGWDITEIVSAGASTQVNRAEDELGVFYAEFAQSFTLNYVLTEDKKLMAYTEWFGLFPAGSVEALPQQYFDGGFTYKVHDNLQFDIRAGVGLNEPADDFFGGIGSVIRL
jgi:hypothetical protein